MLSTISLVPLVIATLAVWRITHLLWGEDGPGDVFVRLRRLAGNGFLGSLLDCFYCLSLWIAVLPAWLLGHTWLDRGLLWLALSAGAILLERISTKSAEPSQTEWAANPTPQLTHPLPGVAPPATWHEEALPPKPREES